jgi:hypothetical protein
MYTRQITIRLYGDNAILVRTPCREAELPFEQFGTLLGLETEEMEGGVSGGSPDAELVLPGSAPDGVDWHPLAKTTSMGLALDRGHLLLRCYQVQPRSWRKYSLYTWQTGLILAGENAILRGVEAVLVHCTLLETDCGAVVLFGESGMGKSTASARWRTQGGKCVSDDMALLDFSGRDQIYVRRMPTWSACKEGKNEWNYPAGEELPLVGVLALGRSKSERDEIMEVSPAQYFAQCYRSMFYWNLFYAGNLPDAGMKVKLTERIRYFTEVVTKRFPPRALMTVLEGDLRSVVEAYLQTQ